MSTLPKVWGVSRTAESPKAALLAFDRPPTDDELRTLHELVRAHSDSSQAAQADWRAQAAAWLRRKAEEQRKTNAAYPEHVKCYPEWEKRVTDLEWLANDLDRESAEAPFGLEGWQTDPAQVVLNNAGGPT